MRKPDPNCCLCGLPYERIGNNPWPLAEQGRCCDACNEVVTMARINPAKVMEEAKRLEETIFRKLGVDIHQVSVAALCAMRGPALWEQTQRELAKLRETLALADPRLVRDVGPPTSDP